MLKVLEREGIIPSIIVGCSIGSLIGAYYSLGFDLAQLEEKFLSLNNKKAIKEFVDAGNPKRSLLKGKKIERYIDKNIVKGSTFKDLKKEFKVVTTDLATGDEIILEKGSLTKSLLASSSIPGIFPPVKIEDNYLVDGGLSNITPIDIVSDMGADIIIGVDLVIKDPAKLKDPGMLKTLLQSYEIMRAQETKSKIKKINQKNTIIIQPDARDPIDSFRFNNVKGVIESGERSTEKVISKIKKQI